MNLNLTNNFIKNIFIIFVIYYLFIYYIKKNEYFQNDNDFESYLIQINQIFKIPQESLDIVIEKTEQTEIKSKEILQLLQDYDDKLTGKKEGEIISLVTPTPVTLTSQTPTPIISTPVTTTSQTSTPITEIDKMLSNNSAIFIFGVVLVIISVLLFIYLKKKN